jgi:protein arginine N-methyltransferase 7
MLEMARRNVLTPDAAVVPAAATMYCMGVEAYTSEVNGFDMSAFNKYRWDTSSSLLFFYNIDKVKYVC